MASKKTLAPVGFGDQIGTVLVAWDHIGHLTPQFAFYFGGYEAAITHTSEEDPGPWVSGRQGWVLSISGSFDLGRDIREIETHFLFEDISGERLEEALDAGSRELLMFLLETVGQPEEED
jgi:hypothetical protein